MQTFRLSNFIRSKARYIQVLILHWQRQWLKQMGYEKVEFVNVDFKNILTGLQDKKYDMAVAALSITPERERLVDFSEAYAEDGYKVIVSKNSKLGMIFSLGRQDSCC